MSTDTKTNTRQRRAARESISPLTRAIRRRRDRSVVVLNDSIGEIEQSSPRISDSINGDGLEAAITTNRVPLAGEFPETSRAIDGDIGDGPLVFGVVYEAETVWSGGILLQVDGEDRVWESWFGIVEKCQLLRRFYCVESVNDCSLHTQRELGEDDDVKMESFPLSLTRVDTIERQAQ